MELSSMVKRAGESSTPTFDNGLILLDLSVGDGNFKSNVLSWLLQIWQIKQMFVKGNWTKTDTSP